MTEIFAQVLAQAEEQGLTSDEHFSVDGTMIDPGPQGGKIGQGAVKNDLKTANPA